MIAVRGTITKFYEKFCHQFGLDSKLADNIVVLAINGSHQLLQKSLA